jgi:outer membrane autotransporter protein
MRSSSRTIVATLLATSSVVAMIAASSGPAYAVPCTTIGNSGFTNPVNTTINCASATNATINGNVVNAGTISPGGPFGIKLSGGTLNGTIINSGTISASTANTTGNGVWTQGAVVTGGISNSGSITSLSGRAIMVQAAQSFGGGIANSGTISANAQGIDVNLVSSFFGGIVNSGALTAATSGIAVTGVSTFFGGITNSGRIQAGASGISVSQVTNFSGGVTNSGTISGGANGILATQFATFAGGIRNSGTIVGTDVSAIGIDLTHGTFFSGGITNTGTINTVGFVGIAVGVSTFSGDVNNSGSISAGIGIEVQPVSTFSGRVINSGTITAGGFGILVSSVSVFGSGTSFSGGISNSGTISIVGSAALSAISVTTVSTFFGGIINSGTIAAGSAIGIAVDQVSSFSGGITNSGAISGRSGIVVSGGTTFSGGIVNSGNITGTAGTAINVSAAPNAMTIDQMAGTIAGAVKLSPFADVVNVTGGAINGNIVGNNAGKAAGNQVNFALGSGTFTYGSTFSISGVNQINVNSGLVILDGTNSAANVAVNGGTLEVGDISHPGALLTAANGLTIGAGGTLAGHGTVAGSIAIPSGATLAPGGSIGTLNITGNLSLAAGSFYQIAVTATGQNSSTVATGTATIAGGTVEVMEQPGNYPPSFKYTILTANGGVNGTFTNATSDFAFLVPVLSYDADDVFLTLSRNPTFFQSQAQTSNQRSVGAALDASPLGSAIVQPVLFQTAAGARQAFDAMSGEIHGSAQSALIDDSLYVRQAMLGRLRQAAFAHGPDVMAALGFAGPDTVVMQDEGPALGYASASASPLKAPPPAAASRFGSDVAFWSQGVGAWGRIGGDGNAADVRRDFGGFFSGVDARFGELARIGLVGGYTHSSLDVSARASSAGIDTAHLGVYAGASVGAFNWRGGAAYGFHTIDTSRSIIFPGFMDSASARYDGGTGQLFGEVGYGVALGRFAAEPFVGLAWVHLWTGSFAETGAVAALNGASNKDDVGYSTLGGRLATSYLLPNGMALIPRVSASWQHTMNDITPAAALAFQNTGAAFAITGVPLARDTVLVETALDLRVNLRAKIGLSYSGQLAGHLQDHSVKGNFTWNF